MVMMMMMIIITIIIIFVVVEVILRTVVMIKMMIRMIIKTIIIIIMIHTTNTLISEFKEDKIDRINNDQMNDCGSGDHCCFYYNFRINNHHRHY